MRDTILSLVLLVAPLTASSCYDPKVQLDAGAFSCTPLPDAAPLPDGMSDAALADAKPNTPPPKICPTGLLCLYQGGDRYLCLPKGTKLDAAVDATKKVDAAKSVDAAKNSDAAKNIDAAVDANAPDAPSGN
ncbi:MAG: hypothetical protein H6707_06810 [Deltaproteobacteria bacterium]|nr:hypothetical protein [Deltaproteobacteria bacterium]